MIKAADLLLLQGNSAQTNRQRIFDGDRFIFATEMEPGSGTPPVRRLQVVLNWYEEPKRLAPVE